MAGTTPIYGIPYPESSDLVANYPALGEDLAETLEDKLPTYAATAPTSPSVGQIWIDSATDAPNFWDGSAWIPFPSGVGDADFSDAATGTYTISGINYKYKTYTGTSTITITQDGYLEVFILSGGSGDFNNVWNGGAGRLERGSRYLTAGTYTVTVGAGSPANSFVGGGLSSLGPYSALRSILWAGLGATTTTDGTGLNDSITGSPVLYGRGGVSPTIANRGEGASVPGAGSSGVVIVRVVV